MKKSFIRIQDKAGSLLAIHNVIRRLPTWKTDESIACMTIGASRISQVLIAITVGADMVFAEVYAYGPDIDGRTPSLADMIQAITIESAIVLAFALAAVALFRWHSLGWWLSVVLDGLFGLAAVSMILGDFKDRFMVTQEGRDAFRGELAIHGAILLLCTAAMVFLLFARKQFLTNKAN